MESGYFAGIEHTETAFSVTTRSASVLSVPVAAGFLFKIDATGVQSFVLGQTRSYTVTRNGISAATVVAPEGWEVKLSEAQISVTSPHSPVTKSVVADSKTDVSVLVSEAFRCSHLVLASATYNGAIFTPMENFLLDLKAHNLQNRTVAVIDNGSWSAQAGRQMRELVGAMKNMTVLEDGVSLKSSVKADKRAELEALADTLAADILG